MTTKDKFMDILNTVSSNAVFSGMASAEISQIISCSNACLMHYKKGDIIFWYKEHSSKAGIVISGNVAIARNDEFGNNFILYNVAKDEFFGLFNINSDSETDDIYAYASVNTDIVLMDSDKLLTGCENKCAIHEKILYNVLTILSRRNIALIRKQCHMAQRTMRKKILSYLTEQARFNSSDCIEIAMNRQEWADYLGIDRSALSAELSAMQKDGLIQYKRNNFRLCDKAASIFNKR